MVHSNMRMLLIYTQGMIRFSNCDGLSIMGSNCEKLPSMQRVNITLQALVMPETWEKVKTFQLVLKLIRTLVKSE